MNIEILKQAIEIARLISCDNNDRVEPCEGFSRFVIVRSRDAGVLFGSYEGNDGSTVHLTNAVQMWRWKAKKGGTLVDCAEFGVEEGKCKFSFAKAKITLFDACAIIDCTDAATTSILNVKGGDWK